MSILDKNRRRVRDIDEKCGVPLAFYWETAEIADWMEEIGYPQYRECIERNLITGRHFICLDASRLPNMGITDFEHIKDITAKVRELINLDHIVKNMSLSMSDPMIAYLENKRRTGRHTQNMSYTAFLAENRRWFGKKK